MARNDILPTIILPLKVLLRQNFCTLMMPRKHGWLVKVTNMKKAHQLLTVMEGELRIEEVAEHKALVVASYELKLFDYKQILSGVTIRLSLKRSSNDFVVISEDAAKHYIVQLIEANLYFRRMTANDYVL